MTSDRWAVIERLYHAAAEHDAEDRDAFLAASCGGNRELEAEVSSLLDAPAEAVAFLEGKPVSQAPEAVACARYPIGSLVGPYQIETELGVGGMGTVFRARDQRLHRTVAIKVLSAALSSDPIFRERFLEEARAVSALSHPNIVVLYDIAENEGVDYLVLEHVRGATLSQIIGPGGLDVNEVCSYGAQAARALAAAHQVGIVHRDIKPANIMITPERLVKILDFGIAKRSSAISEKQVPTGLTLPGGMLGTVPYMSPEQTRGEPLDGRSDIFSLGTVLYQALTGHLPFKSASVLEAMHAIATAKPAHASLLKPSVPAEIDVILQRALEKNRDLRYANAGEFADALDCVSRRPASPAQIKRLHLPFAGRVSELVRLRKALTLARQGSGGTILICGEPGIGKSALLGRFIEEAAAENTFLVGRGACVEQHGVGEAYLPFLQALGQLLSGPRQDRILDLFRRFAPTWCIQFSSLFQTPRSISSRGKQLARQENVCSGSWATF